MKKSMLFLLCWSFIVLAFGQFYDAPAKINPDDIGLIKEINLDQYLNEANRAYQANDYDTSIKNYLYYLQFKPNESNPLYNLACCYGLKNQPDLAAKVLLKSYKAGFQNLGHISQDTDFNKVRASIEFKSAMDSLQKWNAEIKKDAGLEEFYAVKSYLMYKVFFPRNYDPQMTYDLIIGLHGYGDNISDFAKLHKFMAAYDCIVVFPEAPYILPGAGKQGFSWAPMVSDSSDIMEKSYRDLKVGLINLKKELQKKYNTENTYLFGFSQGCFMSLLMGIENAKEFTGIIGFGGGLMTEFLPEKVLKKGKELNVFIAHGKDDKAVPFDSGMKAKEVLEKYGYNLTFKEFKGGHTIDKTSLKEAMDLYFKRN